MVVTDSFTHDGVLGLRFGYSIPGMPTLFVYQYFVDGLLIDTGQRKAQKRILQANENLEVEQLFITHFHEDHSGNIKALQELHGCEAYASTETCRIMKDPPRISFVQQWLWGKREACATLVPVEGVIKTSGHTFELIPIPGHAPDMVALYEPDKKWLFSADLFVNTYIGYFLPDESVWQQMESIKKVLQLDFNILFCSHKPQLTEGREALQKKLDFLSTFFEQVAAQHARGYSEKEIFKNLGLKENRMVKWLSGKHLSKMNMVRSVIRDIEEREIKKKKNEV
ncbi:MBL fold metallo-hydrolase [Muriicola marianensis]|uniref:MBL fold hydrolase n=1 Tax=Muriicola marianensis TaxID=1324801 RepID=A0ABQ1QW32_9FLAO|nr:MBL fold metallo-hydrolase [Muriicola marianensis]GGD49115.1 MBL fold hydrolase [Muriicola marianensis]